MERHYIQLSREVEGVQRGEMGSQNGSNVLCLECWGGGSGI